MNMSLVSGYPHQAFHAGPISHDFYSPYHHGHYQDHHPDTNAPNAAGPTAAASTAAYFQNWMLNSQGDLTAMLPDTYHQGMGAPLSPSEYTVGTQLIPNPDGGPPVRVRCVKRRITANKKERRRTVSINSAFAQLRGCIPNVPSDTKLSKIKTLRLATSYIAYLMDVLAKDDPSLTELGFKAEISKKIERRDDKRKQELVRPHSNGVGGSLRF